MKMDVGRAEDMLRRSVHEGLCQGLLKSLRADVSHTAATDRLPLKAEVRLMIMWPVKAVVKEPVEENIS